MFTAVTRVLGAPGSSWKGLFSQIPSLGVSAGSVSWPSNPPRLPAPTSVAPGVGAGGGTAAQRDSTSKCELAEDGEGAAGPCRPVTHAAGVGVRHAAATRLRTPASGRGPVLTSWGWPCDPQAMKYFSFSCVQNEAAGPDDPGGLFPV